MSLQETQQLTRNRILDAAMDVFSEEGFGGATVTEVERRVGYAVGSGSLYRHFASKEELLRAAVERELTLRRDEMEEAQTALNHVSDPAKRRMQGYKLRLHDMRRFHRLFRLMLNEGERNPRLRKSIWTAMQVPRKLARHEDNDMEALAESAVAGYYLLSLMQGRPYRGVTEGRFLKLLVDATASLSGAHMPYAGYDAEDTAGADAKNVVAGGDDCADASAVSEQLTGSDEAPSDHVVTGPLV